MVASWDLGDRYGVVDADGSRPHFVRCLEANEPALAAGSRKYDDAFYAYWTPAPYEPPGEEGKEAGQASS